MKETGNQLEGIKMQRVEEKGRKGSGKGQMPKTILCLANSGREDIAVHNGTELYMLFSS